jgi:putative DNA primase/helicase
VVTERKLFLCYGAGANGKTTFLETLRAMLGDYAGQILIEALAMKRRGDGGQATPDIADLRGARLVTSSETPEGLRLDEAKVKYLTGMGRLKARYLFSQLFEFDPEFTIFLDCNYRPSIKEDAPAIWDRIAVIPFARRFEEGERDPQLLETLRGELPGILAWAVRGCQRWQRGGLRPPEDVRAAVRDYRAEEDVTGAFLADCCRRNPKSRIKASLVYSAYRSWCERTGEQPMTMNAFGRRMTAHGVAKIDGREGVLYAGLSLR